MWSATRVCALSRRMHSRYNQRWARVTAIGEGCTKGSGVSSDIKERSRLSKEDWREFTKTVWDIANVTSEEHPAVFPVEIPARLIKMFSFCGETVLDPFAGTGTTGRAALTLGRNAICADQNARYVNAARDLLADEDHEVGSQIELRVADSRCLEWSADDSISLVVTSPPYWNKVSYGRKKANLGAIDGYLDVIHALRPACEECYRVLVPGRTICVVTANVNQHTDEGLVSVPLSADLTMLLRDIGFVMIQRDDLE